MTFPKRINGQLMATNGERNATMLFNGLLMDISGVKSPLTEKGKIEHLYAFKVRWM